MRFTAHETGFAFSTPWVVYDGSQPMDGETYPSRDLAEARAAYLNTRRARTDAAAQVELTTLARVTLNIERACEEGRLSEHDRDERIARAEQWCANRVAFIRGEPRPRQRDQQPLDDLNTRDTPERP